MKRLLICITIALCASDQPRKVGKVHFEEKNKPPLKKSPAIPITFNSITRPLCQRCDQPVVFVARDDEGNLVKLCKDHRPKPLLTEEEVTELELGRE